MGKSNHLFDPLTSTPKIGTNNNDRKKNNEYEYTYFINIFFRDS